MTAETIPAALRGRWWLTTAVAALAAVAVAAAAADAFSPTAAVSWLLVTAVPLGYTLWFLRESLALNHPPKPSDAADVADATDAPNAADTADTTDTADTSDATAPDAASDGSSSVYPTLGVANGITIGRGWLYAGVAGFLLVVPAVDSLWRWLPALWYGGGAALDWVDGFVARRIGRRTVLGERLDMAFDTMGFLIAPVVAVAWGALPVWYLSVSAARYCYRFGCWLHERRGGTLRDLPESRVRRPLAGLQMAVITGALLPVTPPRLVWPLATLAVVPSLAVFSRDFLSVTGRLDGSNAPDSPSIGEERERTS